MSHKVVLVTGVADYWGARLAARLLAEPGLHVIGLDVQPPRQSIGELDFIQADVRNPMLAELLQSEGVQAVCHLKFVPTIRPGRVTMDVNVGGAMKVLGACAEAGVDQVVLKSSLAVYGAHPDNSAFVTEAQALRASRRYGYTKDMLEIESFCNDFRHRTPGTALTILRFASIIGPIADTPMTRFLKNALAPALMGFDPTMQVIHEDDVVEALAHAIINAVPDVFNVAAEGTLPLQRLMALAGKPPLLVPHPAVYWGVEALNNGRLRLEHYVPIEPDYLRYPWVGDLTKMRAELGFVPYYTAEEALREFAEQPAGYRYGYGPTALTHDEERLRDTTERRRQARKAHSMTPVEEEGKDNE